MSVRSVLNNLNKGFLICGIGIIKFNQSKLYPLQNQPIGDDTIFNLFYNFIDWYI